MKREEFKARVTMAFQGIPSLDDFLEEAWQVHNEEVAQIGWHTASELPVIPEGKFSVHIIACCHTPSGIYVPVEIAYTRTGGWQYESVKWWCYPPKED